MILRTIRLIWEKILGSFREGKEPLNARKGARTVEERWSRFEAKFKDRKVWSLYLGSLPDSSIAGRMHGSTQIYRRRCAHTRSLDCDSRAFLKSERCIITGAAALSMLPPG